MSYLYIIKPEIKKSSYVNGASTCNWDDHELRLFKYFTVIYSIILLFVSSQIIKFGLLI